MEMMEYFSCASAPTLSAEEEEHSVKSHQDEDENSVADDCALSASTPPPPSLLQSSASSDQSEFTTSYLQQEYIVPPPLKVPVSPSSICNQRKLSVAIAKTPESKQLHPALQGRETVIFPSQDPSPTTPPKMPSTLCARSAPPKAKQQTAKAPRSGPVSALSDRLHSTTISAPPSAGNINSKAVAPLPSSSDEVGKQHMNNIPRKPKLHRAQSAPSSADAHQEDYCVHPAPLRLEAWTEPAAEQYPVRGASYLQDRIKQPSQQSAFSLLTVDLVQADQPIYSGLCAHPNERIQQALAREQETGHTELPPFVFAVNLCVPAGSNKFYHQVTYFGINQETLNEIQKQSTPFGKLMHKFMFAASDHQSKEDQQQFRNATFKLIPRIVEGNYIVRKAVGSKPSILGRKIKQYYIQSDRYFELIVDIASDSVAQRIVKLALGYCKTLVVDMMFVLEGNDASSLPERIFGGVRLKNIDFADKDGKRKTPAVR